MHPNGMRNVCVALAAGILSAILVLPIETDWILRLVLLGLAPLPLFIGGLSTGALTCLAGGLAGAVIVTLVLGPVFGGFYLAGLCAPVAIIVQQALRTDKGGDLLLWLTGLGIAGLLGLIGYLTFFQGGLIATIGARFDLEPAAAAMAARIAPGLVMAVWMATVALCGIGAGWVAFRLGRTLRPLADFRCIRLPFWIGPILMVAGLAGAVIRSGAAGVICLNTAIVLIVPFAFLGLAIIHAQVGKRRDGAIWVSAFYVVFLGSPALFGWRALLIFVLMLAGLGSADQLLDFRDLRGLRSGMRRK
jgi:hypothetical protein